MPSVSSSSSYLSVTRRFLHRSGACVCKNLSRCFSCRFFLGRRFVRNASVCRKTSLWLPILRRGLPVSSSRQLAFSAEGGIFVTLAHSGWSWTLECCLMLQRSEWAWYFTTQVRGTFFSYNPASFTEVLGVSRLIVFQCRNEPLRSLCDSMTFFLSVVEYWDNIIICPTVMRSKRSNTLDCVNKFH